MKKKLLIWLIGLAVMFSPSQGLAAKNITLPKNIYEWAFSTERAGYYFNKQQVNHARGNDGFIDLNTVLASAVFIYDDTQIKDITQKRQWKMLHTNGYHDLIGAAEYMRFDLAAGTVTITRHDDLDSTLTALASETPNKTIVIKDLSEKDPHYRFYKAILDYYYANQEEIIKRSGNLSEADKERLEAAKKEAEMATEQTDGQKDKKNKKDKKKHRQDKKNDDKGH